MLISFVIPVYNAEKFIEKCVDSIIDQPIKNDQIEIILVNDGSKDKTEEICKALSKKHSCLRLFSNNNHGPGYTRNYGLEKAIGKYIWFIDADDYLSPNVLPKVITELVNDFDLYITSFRHVTPENKLIKQTVFKNETFSTISLLKQNYFVNFVWCKLIKKQILEDNNIRFREDVRGPEDFDFSFKLLSKIDKVRVVSTMTYNYIEQPNSLMTLRTEGHMQKLANDSIEVGNGLRKFMINEIKTPSQKEAFESWLSNYLYGLLFSLYRYKHYKPKFVVSALKELRINKNYPIKIHNNKLKRILFTLVANIRPLFMLLVYQKRIMSPK